MKSCFAFRVRYMIALFSPLSITLITGKEIKISPKQITPDHRGITYQSLPLCTLSLIQSESMPFKFSRNQKPFSQPATRPTTQRAIKPIHQQVRNLSQPKGSNEAINHVFNLTAYGSVHMSGTYQKTLR